MGPKAEVVVIVIEMIVPMDVKYISTVSENLCLMH